MSAEINQQGVGNIGIQNVENSTINISQQLGKSLEHKKLLKELQTLKELLLHLPNEKYEKRLLVSKEINDLEIFIKHFEEDVLRLAEQINKIELNTERLRLAKTYFDNGQFEEARITLESDIDQIIYEQKKLLIKQEGYEQNLKKLKHNSEEFLILALSKSLDYSNPNRFLETKLYFELSVKSCKTQENLFMLAKFLAEYNQILEAKEVWEECYELFKTNLSIKQEIELLNNIALTYSYLDNFEKSKSKYEKSLELARELLLTKNTKEERYNLAYVLNNYGLLLTNFAKNDEAEIKLLEALEIREDLAKEFSFENLNNLAITQMNLGFLYRNKEEYKNSEYFYIESLENIESLIETNQFYSIYHTALLKNNLGDLYWRNNQIDLAEKRFEEAMEINVKIIDVEPMKIIPQAVMTTSNLALFYQIEKLNKVKSINLAYLSIVIGTPLLGNLALLDGEMQKAKQVLLDWGYSLEDIHNEIEIRMKEFEEILE